MPQLMGAIVGDRDLRADSRDVRWGVLGAGHISHRFASSLKEVAGARLVAAAGRTPAHVEEFRRAFSIDAAHGYASADDNGCAAYDALIADPDVDAIYLALPHGMHAHWACRALRAGKAVLCEKPAVLSEEEAHTIASVSRECGAPFMEAMKNRFCPMRARVKDLLASGELGRIVSIESVQKLDYGESPSSYLLDPLQGGCLYDMGCYAVGWFEDLLAGACEVSSREVRWRDVSGGRVDWADEIHMSVGGIPIHMVCDGKAAYQSRLTIACERGLLEIERLHRPELAHVKYPDGRMLEINAPFEVDDFYDEIQHATQLIQAGKLESSVMSLAATQRCAHIIDAIRLTL